MTSTLRVLSLGGGTQSCALALMSAAGDLPKLDHVVFADTQGELPETYAYLDYLRPIVEAAGINFAVVTKGDLGEALLATSATDKFPTPPAFIERSDGTRGRVSTYRCSYRYKRELLDRSTKKLCGGPGAWKAATVEQWIGFSFDEPDRMRDYDGCRCGHKRASWQGIKGEGMRLVQVHTADGCTRCDCGEFDPWLRNRWPLIELRMKREDTIRWFADHGHPTPPRSACYFCPNNGNARWRALRDTHPEEWERACRIDEALRSGGGFVGVDFDGQMFIHKSLAPLRVADLRSDAQRLAEDHGVVPLFDADALAEDCAADVCFT